ncbi:MAG: PDZ domain-containing protein [Ignavibacteriales bacterium]|nr:PDZ domain-containing protein [Ignavibacteriales bacterium]
MKEVLHKKADLKGGDIMIKFGEKKITNIYDYVYALQEFVPGDEVDVVVLRDGKELTFHLVLGASVEYQLLKYYSISTIILYFKFNRRNIFNAKES